MSGASEKAATSTGFVLLGLVTAVQLLATFAVLSLPTLAPRAAPSFGVGPEMIGVQISFIYFAASAFSNISGLIVRRYGAVLASTAALIVSGLGMIGVASGSLVVAAIASLMIGVGYGLTNPAASHLLMKHGPRTRQNLVFALKQCGVPIGGVLAALLLPRLAERIGWQWAIVVSSGLLGLLAIVMLPRRAQWDGDRDPSARISGGLLAGARFALANPTLRSLSLMGGTFASFQFCLMSYVITMLVAEMKWDLVSAGVVASIMQAGGAVGRIAWSLIADRIGRGIEILMAIGILASLLAVMTACIGPGWSATAIVPLLAAFAFCLIGWNGVYMAEVARTVGPVNVGIATGGVLVFNFAGVVLGPSVFGLLAKLTGSYALTYGIFSVVPLIGVTALWRVLRRRAGEAWGS
ncbi:MAG TPA: MFS transporter [Hyphomicrobiaceae bacterium]|nr:MFS transporter [Hyphomicrobiaceae bacterium]